MQTNVIAFAAHRARTLARPAACPLPRRSNVIPLASWVGRAVPRRTPTGVFFTTLVLVGPGEIA